MKAKPHSIRRLFRRLVDSLPPVPGPWTPASDKDTELLSFQDFTDEEINSMREALQSCGNDAQLALDTAEDDGAFDSSSDSDDDWDDDDVLAPSEMGTVRFAPKEAAKRFNLAEVSEHARCAFSELYNTDEFQAADSFRRQIFLSVDYLRSDRLTIPLSGIGTIFGVSKSTIAHPLSARTHRAAERWPTAIS
jgi:hypothetical protein